MAQAQQDSCGDDLDVPAELFKEVPIEIKVLHPDKTKYMNQRQLMAANDHIKFIEKSHAII